MKLYIKEFYKEKVYIYSGYVNGTVKYKIIRKTETGWEWFRAYSYKLIPLWTPNLNLSFSTTNKEAIERILNELNQAK